MKALRWLTLPRLVAMIAVLGAFAIAFRAPVDTDMYWHLRAGQWQVDHRAVLTADVFSSTRAGQHWVDVHWLSQVALYGAYALAGNLGLSLFTAILASAGMLLIYLTCDGDALIKAAVTLLAASTAAVFWAPRSQMTSFLFSAAVVCLLWLYQKKGIDRLWVIPIIMIPWANSHGGFAIGFILLALALIGELASAALGFLAALHDHRQPDPAALRPALRLAVIGVVSAAAVVINPFGIETLLLPFRTVGIGVLRDFIQEWAAPNFHMTSVWPFAVMLVGTFGCAGLSSRRLDVRDAVMLVGTAVSALLAGRNIAIFALAAAPILALHLDSFLADQHVALNTGRVQARGVFLAANWLLLALIVFGVGLRMAVELSPARLDKARRDLLPVDAVAYLEREHPAGPLFNSYNWGGYLIWQARDYPVFVDGRTDLYDDVFIRDYLATYTAQPGWSDRLDKAGINSVLVETASPLAQVLAISPGWTKAYADQLAVVYVRSTVKP